MAHVRKQVITFYLITNCNFKWLHCYTYKGLEVKKEHQVLDLDFTKEWVDDY